MSRFEGLLDSKIIEYVLKNSVHEPDLLARLRRESASHPRANFQIPPEEGQLLRVLVRITAAKRAIEVGVFTGYSSIAIAQALPADGKLVACDISEEYTARARRTWKEAGVEDRIELRLGPAVETLDGLIADGQAGSFDFAFIDADKGNYSNYYERSLTLLRRGGVVAADNVLWDGLVADPSDHDPETEAIREFNRKLHGDPRVLVGLSPLGDGLTVACKL